MFRSRLSLLYHLALALTGAALLIGSTDGQALAPRAGDLFAFLLLSVIVKRAGFHVAPKVTHSLVGVVDVAAVMVFGAAGAGWVAGLSGFLHIVGVAARHRTLSRATLELGAFSFGLKVAMAFVGTWLYQASGGVLTPSTLTVAELVPITVLCGAWFLIDHLAWGASVAFERGRAGVAEFLRTIIRASVLVELFPLPLGALLAYLFVNLDRPIFWLIAAGIVLASIAVQRVADLSQAYLTREAELQALNEFGRELSTARLDESQALELLHQFASRIIGRSTFAISLLDETGQEVDARVWPDMDESSLRGETLAALSAQVIESRRPLLTADLAKDYPKDVKRDALRVHAQTSQRADAPADTGSALLVPITTDERVLGVVSAIARQPNQFNHNHERTLSAMAHQVAVAIEQARLNRAAGLRAKQLETIANVSQRVAGIFEVDDLMKYVVALVKLNFGYYHVDIHLAEDHTLLRRAGTVSHTSPHHAVPFGETSLIGAVAKRGKALLVNDVTREPMYAFDPAAPNTAAELVVPLKAEGKLLGVLEVQSDKTGSFSPTDLYVMQTLGDQVALALQQAQLFASVQQEAYVSNVLLQVADAIGSLTDVGEILQTVTRLTPLLVGVQRMIVLLWDYEREALVTAESYGLSQERAAQIKGTPTAASLLFPDEDEIYGTSPKEVTLPEPLAEQWQMSKALALPLVLRGALIGMFCLDVPQPVDARRQSLLAGIANQTALAIEAAQLEYERDKRAGLDQELGIGRSIQAALLPDAPPVIGGFDIAAVWRPARQVAGDFYDFIPLLENHWGLIVADVADKGVPAAIYMTLARTIIRAIALGKASRRTPHQVLERANEIILSDARTDLFVTAFYAVLDPSQNTLCYTNAGHNPPLLVRYEDHRVERLYVPGIALGVLSTIELAEQTVDLQPGDLAVLYTDGVTEATDADYGLFGIERLSGAILDAHHNSAQAVVDRILSAVEAFVGRQEQTDDLTIVVVRRLP